jgi:hypothetical protein
MDSALVASSDSTHVLDSILEAFANMSQQLIAAVCEMFPDCLFSAAFASTCAMQLDASRDAADRRQGLVSAIQAWHTAMSPYYESCTARQDDFIYTDLPLLQALRMRDKWENGLDEESKDVTFDYLCRLNALAAKYAALSIVCDGIPAGMLAKVQQMAAGVVEDIRNGQKSLSDIDFTQLSSALISSMQPEDLAAFQQQLEQSPGGAMGAVLNMVSTVTTVMSDMQNSGEVNGELSGIMSQFMSQLPGSGGTQ